MTPANMPPVMPATHSSMPQLAATNDSPRPVAFANLGYHCMMALRMKPLQNSMQRMMMMARLVSMRFSTPATPT